jgi:hypothetical protein
MIKTLHAHGFIDREPGRHVQSGSDSLGQNCQIWTNLGSPVRWRRLTALRTIAMDEFSDIWIDQCDAAREIRDDWGTQKALGYLVGKKLVNYIRAADSDPSRAGNVPKFAAEIRQIFTDEELRAHFATATRIGVTGHVCTEEQYKTMRDAGAFDEDVVTGATDAILSERARAFLLGGAALDDLR